MSVQRLNDKQMKEERYLSQTFGKGNHFTVPDGYFDNFAQQLMDSLPEVSDDRNAAPLCAEGAPQRRATTRLRLYIRNAVAAACVCGAIIGGTLLMTNGGANSAQAADMSEYYSQDYTIERMADYTMIDSEELYDYLAEE